MHINPPTGQSPLLDYGGTHSWADQYDRGRDLARLRGPERSGDTGVPPDVLNSVDPFLALSWRNRHTIQQLSSARLELDSTISYRSGTRLFVLFLLTLGLTLITSSPSRTTGLSLARALWFFLRNMAGPARAPPTRRHEV